MSTTSKITVGNTEYDLRDADAQEQLTQLKSDLSTVETATDSLDILMGSYITSTDQHKISSLSASDPDRTIAIKVLPGVRYTIKCSIASVKRVGLFASYPIPGTVATQYTDFGSASNDNIEITSGDTDLYMAIQLFTTSDEDKNIDDYIEALYIDWVTAGDIVARDKVDTINISLKETFTGNNLKFVTGGIRSADGTRVGDSNRITTFNALPDCVMSIAAAYGYQMALFAYDGNTYVGMWDGSDWGTGSISWMSNISLTAQMKSHDLLLVCRKSNNDTLIPSDAQNFTFYTKQYELIAEVKETVAKVKNDHIVPALRNGTLGNIANQNAVSIEDIIAHDAATSYTIYINRPISDPSYHYAVNFSTYTIASGKTAPNPSQRLDGDEWIELPVGATSITIGKNPNGTSGIGIAFAFLQRDSSNVSVPVRITDFAYGDIVIIKNYDVNISYSDYYIGTDMLKHQIALSRVGTLKYGQSFLIKDGNYYSTDGANIAKQDSSFNLISDVELSVGHGNSFELGADGKGYVSGWDDNKIYVIDLETLTIEDTITLPTTGYTTCAIDSENGIAYIFQRETRPNTLERYNVITYDYVNEQTLDTKKTSVAFGAMQACVFRADKIFVVNGLGTVSIPNGFRVYTTEGRILCEYIIDTLASVEPEGIAINPDTNDLYISTSQKYVYKIHV